jgi:hypothetical protein
MKVHFVKKARKDNPVAKRGESYFWWKHRNMDKQFSKEQPKRYQLTLSEFWSRIYQWMDEELPRVNDCENWTDLTDIFQELKDGLEEIREDVSQSLENMPEQLQEGHTLQQRLEDLEMLESEMDGIIINSDDLSDECPEELNLTGSIDSDEISTSKQEEAYEIMLQEEQEREEEIRGWEDSFSECKEEIMGLEYDGE